MSTGGRTYIFIKISDIIPKQDVGLYRDDGLAILHKSPREAENIKKKLCQLFNKLGLQIVVEANAKVVDFLDVTLDLRKKEFKPYNITR